MDKKQPDQQTDFDGEMNYNLGTKFTFLLNKFLFLSFINKFKYFVG